MPKVHTSSHYSLKKGIHTVLFEAIRDKLSGILSQWSLLSSFSSLIRVGKRNNRVPYTFCQRRMRQYGALKSQRLGNSDAPSPALQMYRKKVCKKNFLLGITQKRISATKSYVLYYLFFASFYMFFGIWLDGSITYFHLTRVPLHLT